MIERGIEDKTSMPELMTVEEVAEYLRITKRTMYRLLKEGSIPAIRVSHQWRFDRTSIDNWLHQNSTKVATNILVIDDDEQIRSLFEDTVEITGVTATTTGDPYEGLKFIKEKDFDLVFIDLKLPGMDGAELFRQIRLVKPELPVTIITGYPDSDLMAAALARGPLGFMSKPFTSSDILAAVNNYLRFGAHSNNK